MQDTEVLELKGKFRIVNVLDLLFHPDLPLPGRMLAHPEVSGQLFLEMN